MIRFHEDKNRFIDKSTVLTDEQKTLIRDFFKEHPEQEGKIKNWNYSIPYETFEKVIVNLYNKNTPKKGISSLREGTDYDILYKDENYTYYAIYTFEASVVFASNNVGKPFWSKVPRWYKIDNVRKDYPIRDLQNTDIYGGAKWCISMNHTNHYWVKYYNTDKLFFIFGIANDEDVQDIYSKFAATLYQGDRSIYNIFTPDDETLSKSNDIYIELEDIIERLARNFDLSKIQARDYLGELHYLLVPYNQVKRKELGIAYGNNVVLAFKTVSDKINPVQNLDEFLKKKHVTRAMLKNNFDEVIGICMEGMDDFYEELKNRWIPDIESLHNAFEYLLTEGCYVNNFAKEKDTVIRILFALWLHMDLSEYDRSGHISDLYQYLDYNKKSNGFDARRAIDDYLDENYPTEREYEYFIKEVFDFVKELSRKNDDYIFEGIYNILPSFYEMGMYYLNIYYFKTVLEED